MILSQQFLVEDSTGKSTGICEISRRLSELDALQNDTWVILTGEVSSEYVAAVAAFCNAGVPFCPADEHSSVDLTKSLLKQAGLGSNKVTVLKFEGKEMHVERIFEGEPADPTSGTLCLYTTSGTTGKPKPILLKKDAILCSIVGVEKVTGKAPWSGRILHANSPSFDAFLEEVLLSARAGGTLLVPDTPLRSDIFNISRMIKEQEISAIDLPTGLFNAIGSVNSTMVSNQNLTVVIGGQSYSTASVHRFRIAFPNARIVNTYGPTEATITCSAIELSEDLLGRQIIGKPYPEVLWRIDTSESNGKLDEGELQISGPQLSPSITMNPTADWYSTGDRVRKLPSGNLEFLGRTDTMVKIAGKRVDLAALSDQFSSAIKARVHVKVQSSREGIDFLEATAYGIPPDEANKVRRQLRHLVSHQRVPLQVRLLDRIPLTNRGKESYLK